MPLNISINVRIIRETNYIPLITIWIEDIIVEVVLSI